MLKNCGVVAHKNIDSMNEKATVSSATGWIPCSHSILCLKYPESRESKKPGPEKHNMAVDRLQKQN